MKSYTPKHFKSYELVDKETYELLGDNAFKLFDPNLLYELDTLREYFNRPIYINNWYRGGSLSNRGYRTRKSTVGSTTSQHRHGRAVDFDVQGLTADKVRKIILENRDLFPHITRMEDNVSWNHIDTHPDYKQKRIYLFNP